MHKAATSLYHNFINVFVFIHNKKSRAAAGLGEMEELNWRLFLLGVSTHAPALHHRRFCVCFGDGVGERYRVCNDDSHLLPLKIGSDVLCNESRRVVVPQFHNDFQDCLEVKLPTIF